MMAHFKKLLGTRWGVALVTVLVTVSGGTVVDVTTSAIRTEILCPLVNWQCPAKSQVVFQVPAPRPLQPGDVVKFGDSSTERRLVAAVEADGTTWLWHIPSPEEFLAAGCREERVIRLDPRNFDDYKHDPPPGFGVRGCRD